MPLIPSIAVGSSDEAVKHAILSSISYKEGAGAIAGIDTWEELTAAFNSRAIAYGTNKIVPFEKGSVTRPKINAMLTGLGLTDDLDLYYDAALGRAVAGQAVVVPSNLIADTHNDANLRILNASGLWQSVAANTLSVNSAGLHTAPGRTNQVINNTLNSGTGFLLTGTTLAANTPGDSPANDNNAKRVTQGAGASDSHGRSGLVCTADTYYAFTISFKYDASATWVRVVFSDNVANGWQCWVNLQTKTIGTVSVFGTAVVSTPKIVLESGGWFRLELSGKCTPAVASGTMATIVVNADGSNTRAAGTYLIWLPQFELGTVASPPIVTTGSAVSRLGNQQLITGLGASLSTGIAGYIKFRALGMSSETKLFQFNNGTTAHFIEIKCQGTNSIRVVVTTANVVQAAFNINGTFDPTVDQTIAFCVANNYANARLVGQTDIAPVTTITWPTLDRFSFGGAGHTAFNNSYVITKKLAAKYLVPANSPATEYANMYALAAAA